MKIINLVVFSCFCVNVFAQNSFPTTGNVGINLGGYTSQNKLQIGPNLQGWSSNDLVVGNSSGSLAIHTDASQTYLYGSKDIAIRPGYGTYGILAKANGFVGIGSTNPQALFQVNDVRPVIIKNNGGNGIYGSEIGFNAILNTSVVPNQFKKLGGTNQYGGASMAVDHRGNIFFQMYDANTDSESTINFNPQIVFQNTGRVGLGVTSPQTLLNLNQGAGDGVVGTPSLRIGGTGNYPSLEFGIKGAYDGMISTYGNDLHIYAGNWRSSGATASENHSISFYTSQSGSSNWNTPKLILKHDGNVGIGTTAPDSKLTVKGDIHTREVKVDLAGAVGPDYVFEKDYPLTSIEELKSYIDQNKHLPEIPSAKEMEENGINLKEMNLLLLKKVEELTLHVIKQQEIISVQNDRLNKLEGKER